MNKLPKRKYGYPEGMDIDEWVRFLDDTEDVTLKKFYRYLPTANTALEIKMVDKITDEMVSRGLL